MTIFERYLTLWVAACIVVGIALGHFVPSVFVAIGSAEGRSWRRLEPTSGTPRAGFPPPAVSTSEGWCVGVARLDFDGPPRPSVAR